MKLLIDKDIIVQMLCALDRGDEICPNGWAHNDLADAFDAALTSPLGWKFVPIEHTDAQGNPAEMKEQGT